MASGMAKMIESAPGVALASRIACRSEPAPLSAVVVTVKTVEGVVRSSSVSIRGRKGGRFEARRTGLRLGRATRERSPEGRGVGDLHVGHGRRSNVSKIEPVAQTGR